MYSISVSKTKEHSFRSLNEALASLTSLTDPNEIIEINIDEGIYEEKVAIRCNNLRLIGAGKDKTILTWHDGAKTLDENNKPYGTFNSYSVLFAGDNIVACDLAIENTSGPGYINGQAVAAFITSDKTSFYRCRFLGNQDTIYAGVMTEDFYNRMKAPEIFKASNINVIHEQGRNYFEDCYIEGDVDYIFGSNLAYFNHCTIMTKSLRSESCAYITAPNTPQEKPFGYIFNACEIKGEDENHGVYLGRPWRDHAKTIFIDCTMDASIHPHGWHNWDKPLAEMTTQYIEIDNHGPGAKNGQRAAFSKQLTGECYRKYLALDTIFPDFDQWIR